MTIIGFVIFLNIINEDLIKTNTIMFKIIYQKGRYCKMKEKLKEIVYMYYLRIFVLYL